MFGSDGDCDCEWKEGRKEGREGGRKDVGLTVSVVDIVVMCVCDSIQWVPLPLVVGTPLHLSDVMSNLGSYTPRTRQTQQQPRLPLSQQVCLSVLLLLLLLLLFLLLAVVVVVVLLLNDLCVRFCRRWSRTPPPPRRFNRTFSRGRDVQLQQNTTTNKPSLVQHTLTPHTPHTPLHEHQDSHHHPFPYQQTTANQCNATQSPHFFIPTPPTSSRLLL